MRHGRPRCGRRGVARRSRSGSSLHELGQYQPELLERPRVVVGTKADIAVADWSGLRISAVTGEGVRELVGRMAALVHEARSEQPVTPGIVIIRPEAEGGRAERMGEHEFRLIGRQVERVVALNDVTTPEALSYIDHQMKRLGVPQDPGAGRSAGRRHHLGRRLQLRVPAGGVMRLVAKIGTSSITDALGVIDDRVVDTLCDQLAAACEPLAHEVILVSSGAVSAGVAAMGMSARPTDMPTLQAISAAGQSRLMETYNRSLARHHLVAAQVLLVPNDFVDRRQYLHARQTLLRLIELGCIPIINENDAIGQSRAALRRQRSHRRARRPQRATPICWCC